MGGMRFYGRFSPFEGPHSIFLFILFLAIFSLGLPVLAAESYYVTGLVHDKTGAAIPGAEAALRRAGAGTALTTQTDGHGKFSRSLFRLQAIMRSR